YVGYNPSRLPKRAFIGADAAGRTQIKIMVFLIDMRDATDQGVSDREIITRPKSHFTSLRDRVVYQEILHFLGFTLMNPKQLTTIIFGGSGVGIEKSGFPGFQIEGFVKVD